MDDDTMDTGEIEVTNVGRFRIEGLKPDKYFIQPKKIEFILRGKELWEIVHGSESDSPQVFNTQDEASRNAASKDEGEMRKTYQRNEDVAFATIWRSMKLLAPH